MAAGKQWINWQVDPPPDLVIEVDVTSFTQVEDYLPYRIPEVWLLKQQTLQIYHLQAGAYVVRSDSRYFPGIDVADLTARCFEAAYARNTGSAIRALRKWLIDSGT